MDLEGIFRSVARLFAEVIGIRNDFHPEVGGHMTFSFLNNSGQDLALIDRNNDVQIVPQGMGGNDTFNPGLRIKQVRYNTSYNAGENMTRLLVGLIRALGRSNAALENSLMCAKTATRDAMGRYWTERAFDLPIDRILNSDGVLEEQTGYLVVPTSLIGRVSHPDSVISREHGKNTEHVKNRPTGRLIEIVDNNAMYKERFVFMCNEVVRVPAVRDRDRIEGVWVTEVRDVGAETSKLEAVRYSFEEGFKRYGLWPTREEAESNGNPAVTHQRALEELKRQNEQLSAEIRLRDTRHAAELAERKQEYERKVQSNRENEADLARAERVAAFNNEQELAHYKSVTAAAEDEARRRKIREDMEHHSYSSSLRTSSETFKYMPAIIAGAVGLSAGIAAFFWRR